MVGFGRKLAIVRRFELEQRNKLYWADARARRKQASSLRLAKDSEGNKLQEYGVHEGELALP